MNPYETTMAALLAENPRYFYQIADFFYSVCERDPATAERYLANVPTEGSIIYGTVWPRAYREACVARMEGDASRARSAFAAARAQVEKNRGLPNPTWLWLTVSLGLIDAGLGRKEEAIAEGRRACELLPVSKDAFIGSVLAINLAQILAWSGEKTAAIELLLTIPSASESFSYGQFKLNPAWDSLRGDPRFEALVASLAPKPIP